MSKLHVVLNGEQSPGKVTVFGKKREITPFIGVIKREDGSFDRGIGAKCPNQEKLIFRAIDSNDPLVYLRAFKMLSELGEITDELTQDCVIATQNEHRLENFSQTNVYLKNGGAYRQAMLYDAQRKAFTFKPSPEIIQQVIDGFSEHLVPLAKKEALEPTVNDIAPSCSVISLTKLDALPSDTDGPAKRGFFYDPLVHPRKGLIATQAV